MHFEFLMEDQSGGTAMGILAPKLLGEGNSFRIHPYKGIGQIPSNIRSASGVRAHLLLNHLPSLLRAYGRVKKNLCVIVICDLDSKDKKQFVAELNAVLHACNPMPLTRFCLSIEEFEAWYLGDINAIRKAYPSANESVLSQYVNDSICGTWETLADAICKGGHKKLSKQGWQAVGKQKAEWAKTICPHMDVDANKSPSFNYLLKQLRRIVEAAV